MEGIAGYIENRDEGILFQNEGRRDFILIDQVDQNKVPPSLLFVFFPAVYGPVDLSPVYGCVYIWRIPGMPPIKEQPDQR